ncbi:MAG: cupin domain-containing protein [candidate division KSB1 bacterium]|nr:cupin domain-containing protein [candidate division KSB1 bacterium]MDZ7366122.1 cupin domain-containing protein [candidate division KSB1 bacterium]MDZ7404236.1 cupin domain-containing protein [candidate division KSB1 bacterium]
MQDVYLDQIELYLLGALAPHEEKQLRAHLATGCVECTQAMAESSRVMRALPWAWLSPSELVVPPVALKQRLLDSIKNTDTPPSRFQRSPQIWKSWPDESENLSSLPSGLLTVHAHEGVWEDIGVNGILVKRLFVDRANDRATMLVRMPAGASYPRHRHAGAEQCYVLEGDLRFGGRVFRAGDFQCAEADSIHDIQYTEAGCLLLIVSSLHDEIVDA